MYNQMSSCTNQSGSSLITEFMSKVFFTKLETSEHSLKIYSVLFYVKINIERIQIAGHHCWLYVLKAILLKVRSINR